MGFVLRFGLWSVVDFYLDFSGFCFNGGLGWLGFSVNFFFILGQWDNESCLKLNWVFNFWAFTSDWT